MELVLRILLFWLLSLPTLCFANDQPLLELNNLRSCYYSGGQEVCGFVPEELFAPSAPRIEVFGQADTHSEYWLDFDVLASAEVWENALDFKASRIFAGKNEYPPHEFAAYAIVAFRSLPSRKQNSRYQLVCEVYSRALSSATTIQYEKSQQLVTIWPLAQDSSKFQFSRNQEDIEKNCEIAVANYGHEMATDAISAASEVVDLEGNQEGPFIFAWSPARTYGSSDALILRMDLSAARTEAQLRRRLEIWAQSIESDKALWKEGWTDVGLRQKIGELADNFGEDIWSFLKILKIG